MKSAQQPNLVVFVAEGMPAGTIAALGGRGIHTPNLDRLASRSAVLKRKP